MVFEILKDFAIFLDFIECSRKLKILKKTEITLFFFRNFDKFDTFDKFLLINRFMHSLVNKFNRGYCGAIEFCS